MQPRGKKKINARRDGNKSFEYWRRWAVAAELLGVSDSDSRGQTFIILQASVLSGKRPRGKNATSSMLV